MKNKKMGYGKVGVSKDEMCSYKLSHNSAVHSYNFDNRMLDVRLGRWMSLDPILQPSYSPYMFVDNNPIIYVDRNGEDNVIYLVALPSSSTTFTKQDLQKIADKANELYKNLGLETRVVVYESTQPFGPSKLDPTDGYVLIGSVEELQTTVAGEQFDDKIRDAARVFTLRQGRGEVNPENSAIDGKGILIATDDNDLSLKRFSRETFLSNNESAAFLIIHGSGHNAAINKHVNEFASKLSGDNASIMYNGNGLANLFSGKGSESLSTLIGITSPSSNQGFIEQIIKPEHFGTNKARDNINFKGVPYKIGAENPKTVDETTPLKAGSGVKKSSPTQVIVSPGTVNAGDI